MADIEDNELNLDEIDFDLDGEEEGDAPTEPTDKEDGKKGAEEDNESLAELAQLRKERDELRAEKDILSHERDDADFKAQEANYIAAQTAINQWQSEVKKESTALSELEGQLVEAQINGDVEKAKSLTRTISEKRNIIGHIQGEITKYSPILNNKPTRKESQSGKSTPAKEANPAVDMAEQWEKENSWYNDPKYSAKREKAEALLTEWVKKGYNPGKINFWSRMDAELEAFDKKEPEKRRTPPAFAPRNNNGGSKQVTNKRKADAEILATAQELLRRRGVTKADPRYTQLQKSYYKTALDAAVKEKANG